MGIHTEPHSTPSHERFLQEIYKHPLVEVEDLVKVADYDLTQLVYGYGALCEVRLVPETEDAGECLHTN